MLLVQGLPEVLHVVFKGMQVPLVQSPLQHWLLVVHAALSAVQRGALAHRPPVQFKLQHSESFWQLAAAPKHVVMPWHVSVTPSQIFEQQSLDWAQIPPYGWQAVASGTGGVDTSPAASAAVPLSTDPPVPKVPPCPPEDVVPPAAIVPPVPLSAAPLPTAPPVPASRFEALPPLPAAPPVVAPPLPAAPPVMAPPLPAAPPVMALPPAAMVPPTPPSTI